MKRHGTISWKIAGPSETADEPSAGSESSTERSCTPRTVYGLCVVGGAESAAIASGAAIVNAIAVNTGFKMCLLFMASSFSFPHRGTVPLCCAQCRIGRKKRHGRLHRPNGPMPGGGWTGGEGGA